MISIGTKIGERYEVIGNIGSGGMANVYLAQDLILNREVAIKVLRFDFQNDTAAIRRFQREALAATEMVHPNIVSVYDVGEENGMQFIVMEYVKGTDLKQYIRNSSLIPLPTVVNMMEQILSAIETAHQHGIIHRDLKPQNILVDEYGTVKITDFGIAIALSETSLTQTNTLLGSVHYLSPEQARGSMATRQSDIYALGIILYELLTGTVPFEGESAVSIALKHFQKDMPSVRQFNPQIPQSLENVVLKATAKETADRYMSVNEMAEDLRTSLSVTRANELPYEPVSMLEETIAMTPIDVPSKPSKPRNNAVIMDDDEDEDDYNEPPKKKKGLWIFLSIIVVLVLAGVGLFFLGNGQSEVEIPDVSNMSESQAISELEKVKIKVDPKVEEIADDKIEKGNVVKTQPPIGTKIKESSTITLYISKGKTTEAMIDVEGSTVDDAKRQLESFGFKKDKIKVKEEFSDKVDVDEVMAQSIKPDTDIVPGDETITLTVSKGPEGFSLEYLAGFTREQVMRYIDEEGLYMTESREYSSSVPYGQVIYTSPNGGTPMKKGDTVQVVFSIGAEPVKEPEPQPSKEPEPSSSISSEPEESEEEKPKEDSDKDPGKEDGKEPNKEPSKEDGKEPAKEDGDTKS